METVSDRVHFEAYYTMIIAHFGSCPLAMRVGIDDNETWTEPMSLIFDPFTFPRVHGNEKCFGEHMMSNGSPHIIIWEAICKQYHLSS